MNYSDEKYEKLIKNMDEGILKTLDGIKNKEINILEISEEEKKAINVIFDYEFYNNFWGRDVIEVYYDKNNSYIMNILNFLYLTMYFEKKDKNFNGAEKIEKRIKEIIKETEEYGIVEELVVGIELDKALDRIRAAWIMKG